MGGFFGVASKEDCVFDLFFGTDYHSHLGTRRAGMVVYGKERGFDRAIHNIENAPFRTKFDKDFNEMEGNIGIGSISDFEPQPLMVRSHHGTYAIATVGKINNAAKLTKVVDADGKTYPRGRIYAIGDIILIKKPAVKKVKTTAKIKPAAATPEPIPNDVRPNTSAPAEKDCARFPIKRRYGDFSFLIGKTADKNITNFYGEIMLKQGEKITLDALRQAKLSGKLIELCLHAK